MYKMKQKMAVILSSVLLMASLLPLTANAYTDREIRKMLGISTMEDMAMELVERDVLNQLNEGNMITITESDSSVISNAVFDTEYYADKYPDLKAAPQCWKPLYLTAKIINNTANHLNSL